MQTASIRLVESVPLEAEWLYLTTESLVGEKCGVRLLKYMISRCDMPSSVRNMIEAHLADEVRHVRLYAAHVGPCKLSGSGYDEPFEAHVRALPTITLKLFAIQAVLEGAGLGALKYRLQHWPQYPTKAADEATLGDELRHLELSYPLFRELIAFEGGTPTTSFLQTARSLNAIFSRASDEDNIRSAVTRCSHESSGQSAPYRGPSAGLKLLRRLSAENIVAARTRFIRQHAKVAAAC